ncbi:hypothetical protein RQP46_001276 [Phenoliferia psychrophenolica]
MSPNPVDEFSTFTLSTLIAVMSGNIITPIVSCALGLPGCDGSTSRWLVPGKEVDNPFSAAIQFPGSAVSTGFQTMTGAFNAAMGVMDHMWETPQYYIGRFQTGKPWKGREARIGSPIRGKSEQDHR